MKDVEEMEGSLYNIWVRGYLKGSRRDRATKKH